MSTMLCIEYWLFREGKYSRVHARIHKDHKDISGTNYY